MKKKKVILSDEVGFKRLYKSKANLVYFATFDRVTGFSNNSQPWDVQFFYPPPPPPTPLPKDGEFYYKGSGFFSKELPKNQPFGFFSSKGDDKN